MSPVESLDSGLIIVFDNRFIFLALLILIADCDDDREIIDKDLDLQPEQADLLEASEAQFEDASVTPDKLAISILKEI